MIKTRGDWRDIFNGFSVALDVKKLLAGFVALCLTFFVLGVAPVMFAFSTNPALAGKYNEGHYTSLSEFLWPAWQWIWVMPSGWVVIIGLYLLTCVIWSFFGGLITRIGAINLTKDEGLETSKALSFTTKKYLSYLAPFIICIIGILFFFGCNALGGLIGRIPFVGELLVAIFIPLAILSGFIMLFITIGFIFGSPMFYPTIGVEGSDSFDAMSRSFSYIYSRPWHYIWYQLVAAVYGVITIAFVWTFGYFMIYLGLWAAKIGMGADKFSPLAGLASQFKPTFMQIGLIKSSLVQAGDPITYHIASYILFLWLVFIVGLIAAYAVSYWYSSQTIIYLLLRKKVDDIDVTEVYEEKEEEELSSPTQSEESKPESEAKKD